MSAAILNLEKSGFLAAVTRQYCKDSEFSHSYSNFQQSTTSVLGRNSTKSNTAPPMFYNKSEKTRYTGSARVQLRDLRVRWGIV